MAFTPTSKGQIVTGGTTAPGTGDTHSFLSRAFSSSLVNRLFSPICVGKEDSVVFLTCFPPLHRLM